MSSSQVLYFKAMIWAILGGTGDGVLEFIKTFLAGHGLAQLDWHQVGQSAAYSAVVAAAAYLKLPHGATAAPPSITPPAGQ